MNSLHNKRMLVGAGLLVIGVIIFVSLLQGLLDAARSTGWPSVTGTVVSSTVERRVELDDDGDEDVWFTPRVTYRYTVGGVTREGRMRSLFEASSSDEAVARRESGRYAAGSAVRVYHSPDGTRAVLEPGLTPGTWGWLLLPGAAMIVGVALLVGPRNRAAGRFAARA